MPLYDPNVGQTTTVTVADTSLAGWTFDPVNLQAGLLQLGGGTLQVARLKIGNADLISSIICNLTLGGLTLTSGRNFAGLYSDSGQLLGQTADQTTAWGSTGLKTMALTVPTPVTPWSWYKIGWFNNGLTVPSMSRGQNISAATLNAGMSGQNLRFSTADTGLTTALPAQMTSLTASDVAWWLAVS